MTKIEEFVIQRVKELRTEKGLSQQALADYMNVGQSFIRDVENSKKRQKYNLNHLNDLALTFNCDFADFFPDKPFENNKEEE